MKLLLLAALLPIGISTIDVPPILIPNDFTYIEVPPLSYIADTKIKVEGAFLGNKSRSCSVYIFNSLFPSGKEVCSDSGRKGFFDFEFTLSKVYTTPDIYLTFKELTSSRTVNIYPRFVLSPTITLNDSLEHVSYETITVYTHEDGVNYLNETYSFSGYKSLYAPDYYHKLDLSSLKLKTGCDNVDSFKYRSAFLYLYDPTNMFEEFIDYKTGDYLVIPLDFVKNEDDYYYPKSKNTLYVHPITLKMSLTEKNGYVKTRHIYLPINQRLNEQKYRFVISISDVGFNMAYISHNFLIKTYKNIIGDKNGGHYYVTMTASSGERINP